MAVLRITDDSPPEDIAEALVHLAHTAMREPGIVRKTERDDPTRWDRQHELINEMLVDLKRRQQADA